MNSNMSFVASGKSTMDKAERRMTILVALIDKSSDEAGSTLTEEQP